MGVYLNSKKPYILFQEEEAARYFVDKSKILDDLVPVVEWTGVSAEEQAETVARDMKYICITRPRRFGKTVMANMISSYFGKGVDSRRIFQDLAVSDREWFEKHLNRHNVIHIMFNEMPDDCTAYAQYIARIKKRLMKDLTEEFPEVPMDEEDALWDIFNSIIEFGNGEKFIFVLDEWDFIFHRDFVTEKDRRSFISFLRNLLKDQPYVEMAYMTGILPIAKYSSGSELNMFSEYTMVSEEKFSGYFGFTETEVDSLYERFLEHVKGRAEVTREGLAEFCPGWYVKDPEVARRYKFSLTPVSWRKENREKLLEKSRKQVSGEMPVKIEPSGEEGVRQMRAILGLDSFVTNVNMPNRGQIGNIGQGVVVESNAVFSRNSVRPVFAGHMDPGVLNLINPHIYTQNAVIEACLTRSLEPAYRAFAQDPLVSLSIDDVKSLFEEMAERTSAYLSYYH